MVEETQPLEITAIMRREITDSAGAIAYWEYIAAFVEQTFDPYLKHAQEVITMAKDQGDSPRRRY